MTNKLMTDLRDQIATIVWLHKDYSEGYDAADAIMELVVWVRDLATDLNLELATELNNAEARINKLEGTDT